MSLEMSQQTWRASPGCILCILCAYNPHYVNPTTYKGRLKKKKKLCSHIIDLLQYIRNSHLNITYIITEICHLLFQNC